MPRDLPAPVAFATAPGLTAYLDAASRRLEILRPGKPTASFPAGDYPTAVAITDLNGDGRADIVVTDTAANELLLWFGNPDGSFTAQPPRPARVHMPGALKAVDGGILVTSIAGGQQRLVDVARESAIKAPAPMQVSADFNHDGIPDLAIAVPNNILILLGKADGSYAPALFPLLGLPANATSLAIDDYDHDGHADLLVDNGVQPQIFFGDGNAGFTAAAVTMPTVVARLR